MGTPNQNTNAQSVASNGKNQLSVSIPAMKIPQPYADANGDPQGSPQAILQNDALAKQFTANGYYNSLTDQAPKLLNAKSS